MNYVFFGTPRFAAIILQKLIDAGMPPALVVCNPDRPAGRRKIITAPETKVIAEKNGVSVLQPEKLSDISGQLSGVGAEVFVVAAYAKIIPRNILDTPKQGAVGVHPSLLPKYRGPSPIQQAILDGAAETGVTLYLLDEKVDHGPVLAKSKLQTADSDSHNTLEEKLAHMAGELLAGILPRYVEGGITPQEQNHTEATFTKKFTAEDGFIDLSKDNPEIIARKIRALNPEPGVWAAQNGKRLKLLEVEAQGGKWIVTKTHLEGKNPKEDRIIL